MRRWFWSGTVAGLLLVAGEGILNGAFLKDTWLQMNQQLGLPVPSPLTTTLILLKLFALGFVLIWVYDVVSCRHGRTPKSALLAGLFMALLVWGWVLAGLLLAGYINNDIALPTFLWGLVELPVVTLIGANVFNRIGR